MRALSLAIAPMAALIAFAGLAAPAAVADPAVPDPGYDAVTYLIGTCWDPSQPVVQEPTTVKYNCDGTSVMQDMTWTSWGAAAQLRDRSPVGQSDRGARLESASG